jgi:hypothetical protein
MGNPVTSPIHGYWTEGRLSGARLCHFGNKSAVLLEGHKKWIRDHLIPKLKNYPNAWIDLHGHTSRLGSESSNITLGAQRIAAVEQFIKSNYPGININWRNNQGESDAKSFNYEEKNNDGFWRAVIIRWFGIPIEIPTPPYPEEKPFRGIEAAKGCWNIISVDTFGVPIKAGVGGGSANVTILNDKGEKWLIKGAGISIGADVSIDGPKIFQHLKGAKEMFYEMLKGIVLKAGDLQNINDTLKKVNDERKITGPSETGGAIFKGTTLEANLTHQQIVGQRVFFISSGELHGVAMGGEVGLIRFGTSLNPFDTIWGYYLSLGLGTLKAAVGVSGTFYKTYRVEKVN